MRDEFGKRHYRKKYNNRRVVVVAREPFGKTEAFVGKKESDSLTAISRIIAPDSFIHADGSRAWNRLSGLYKMARVEHNDVYSQDGVTNWAESYFAMLRKMHYGIHHHISARYLETYANELAWRQGNREMKESDKASLLLRLCLSAPPSKTWSRYWQRRFNLPQEQNIKTAESQPDMTACTGIKPIGITI